MIAAFLNTNKYIINELDQNKNNKIYINEGDEYDENKNEEEDKEHKNDEEFYDLLSNFYLKELKKLIDINYKSTILKQILNDDKIIKRSFESFKTLFKNILTPNEQDEINVPLVVPCSESISCNLIC